MLDAVKANLSTIKNFVLTSSMASVKTANFVSADFVYTKDTWSNVEKMRETKNWYALSKTLAE